VLTAIHLTFLESKQGENANEKPLNNQRPFFNVEKMKMNNRTKISQVRCVEQLYKYQLHNQACLGTSQATDNLLLQELY
jgi:hypothetical protein